MLTRETVLAMTDAELVAIARSVRAVYGLKRTIRYGSERDCSFHNESVAEHVYGLHQLAHFFLALDDPDGKLDRAEMGGIIDYHDIGEIVHGDKIFAYRTQSEEDAEQKAALELFSKMPEPFASSARRWWQHYQDRDTPEARFVYALDKIEPAFELLDSINEKSQVRNKITYEKYLTKYPAVEPYSCMHRMGMAIGADMRKRGVFYK